MASFTASMAGVKPAGVAARATLGSRSGVVRVAVAARRPGAVRTSVRVTASAGVGMAAPRPSERLALAAVMVAGSHAAALNGKPGPLARFASFAREQSAAGKEMVGKMGHMDATVLFVVAATMSVANRKMIALTTQAVGSFIKLYLLLLFIRVLLTWFPNVDWMRNPWSILRQVTDPYLNLFRNLIPPIMGQIDFTPILGFMVLQFLAKVLTSQSSMGKF
mmetsp:Transcript_34133/g.83667  ORF Transcript_34133/g.83667 Transcript_34133/m.83667 type:complete len:220 (-) Transcript_34133:129-788(-)|eukprot:CAMPEP_0197577116 /NCGR_PEP_ID=MMETSP1326-20131121/1870_1 /TAXON_ID=1155430 /ORGANISM="Genus nov. species nov., Strain RCC2288" /LENGTH=219 /DNA_ID=CAMNT_0043140133 /DNA_START=61 /DNA_END=720 /DNA_ORIENTATION=+